MNYNYNEDYNVCLDNIKRQLCFLNDTMLPAIANKHVNKSNNVVVSREKLIDLWINRRGKAIKIINNNGAWPTRDEINITVNENEA